jgi:hypothetical protein
MKPKMEEELRSRKFIKGYPVFILLGRSELCIVGAIATCLDNWILSLSSYANNMDFQGYPSNSFMISGIRMRDGIQTLDPF